MRIFPLLKTEWQKQKRGFLLLFLLIIPSGTTLAMFLDMNIRYDYLMQVAEKGESSWDVLLNENHRILGWGTFLPLFIAAIFFFIFQVEHQQNSWKHLLSLPVHKVSVYVSKWLAGLMYIALLIVLNTAGLVLVGKVMEFPEAVDWGGYGMYVLNQFVLALAVTALQQWLSSWLRNPFIPVALAFAGLIIGSILSSQEQSLLKLVPYAYTSLAAGDAAEPSGMFMYSILCTVLFLLIGSWQFRKKDIL
ncbi:ABC transporter permease [Bacillus xiapuensis]|uniref:ABC transporter permease n=1 Tax=Bacillus xiapuensis TaxID=2014075 RepID=UPI000C237C0C|nr:ABC transporter permease [Bacillus xiapuensis]